MDISREDNFEYHEIAEKGFVVHADKMDRTKEEAIIKQGQVKFKEGGIFALVSLYRDGNVLAYAIYLKRFL